MSIKLKDSISANISKNANTATTLATARTINGTSFNGSANITTANWGTARTLTIGKTGKSVNGSANVSWSTSEILGQDTITTGDWNSANTTGVYEIRDFTGSNGPTGAYKWGGLLTLRHGNVQNQVYLSHGNNEMWIRGGWAGTWNSSWSRVYTTNYKPTLADIGHSTYTRSSIGTLDWDSNTQALLTKAAVAHWNGAYSGTTSNLAYCNRGAFGTIVTKNIGDYASANHTHSYMDGINDTRSNGYNPSSAPKRFQVTFQSNGTNGVADGGSYYSLMHIPRWNDGSGGYGSQIAFTDNNNVWYRRGTGDNSWTGWNRMWHSGNFNPDSRMGAHYANSYWGLTQPNGDNSNWIRTTANGLIPYQSGGYSSIGTDTWPFTHVYANHIVSKAHASIQGTPLSIQSSAPSVGGIWIQI